MSLFERRGTRPRARGGMRAGLALALAAAALLLADCSPPTLPCPTAKILREASSVTRFAPGQPPSPQSVAFVGSVNDAKLTCSYDPTTYERLSVTLGIQIVASRPQGSSVPAADLRYFVAIVNLEGELLAKKEFPLQLAFPAGATTVSTVEETREYIPLKYPQNGGSLQIWTGFQLNDNELKYNREHFGG